MLKIIENYSKLFEINFWQYTMPRLIAIYSNISPWSSIQFTRRINTFGNIYEWKDKNDHLKSDPFEKLSLMLNRTGETSVKDVHPTIQSWMQSMVHRTLFVIKMRFQSQYTYTFMLKVRTHVQFDSASQTRPRSKTGRFLWRTNERTLDRWAPSVRKKVRPSAGKRESIRK